MNNASGQLENLPEFYRGRRTVSLPGPNELVFVEMPLKKKISYGEDGRRLVDGAPERCETPNKMWDETLLRMACHVSCHTNIKERVLKSKRRKEGLPRRLTNLLTSGGGSILQRFGSKKDQQQNDPSAPLAAAGGGAKMDLPKRLKMPVVLEGTECEPPIEEEDENQSEFVNDEKKEVECLDGQNTNGIMQTTLTV